MPAFSISHEDTVRLRHMLDAALEIRGYVQASKRQDLNSDRMLVHSLVRLFEIISEAASQVSDDLKDNCPAIPWLVMTNMRNRLIHAYFAIDLNVVWSTSTEDIPMLVTELKRLQGQ
jgi:uncharacterized protein with HEPN domain